MFSSSLNVHEKVTLRQLRQQDIWWVGIDPDALTEYSRCNGTITVQIHSPPPPSQFAAAAAAAGAGATAALGGQLASPYLRPTPIPSQQATPASKRRKNKCTSSRRVGTKESVADSSSDDDSDESSGSGTSDSDEGAASAAQQKRNRNQKATAARKSRGRSNSRSTGKGSINETVGRGGGGGGSGADNRWSWQQHAAHPPSSVKGTKSTEAPSRHVLGRAPSITGTKR